MAESKLLIVSGGGQLDEFWGGPWGHPYAMFKWSTAAWIRNCRVVFLSVGAGTLANSKSRRFIRRALNIAFYKSFRDPRTVATVKSMHVGGELHLVPDLAFSHPAGRAPQPAVAHASRRVIGLSPIVYKDPLRWPEKDGAFFEAYLDQLTRLGVELLARGDSVCVLTSDYADNSAAEELFARIAKQVPADNLPRLLLPDTTDELLEFLQHCDLLVASRLHGAILAQLVATPVVAISYNWKVDEQMRRSDCAQYCVSIEKFSVPQVIGLIDRALAERITLSERLASAAASAFSLLDRQYQDAFRFETATARR